MINDNSALTFNALHDKITCIRLAAVVGVTSITQCSDIHQLHDFSTTCVPQTNARGVKLGFVMWGGSVVSGF